MEAVHAVGMLVYTAVYTLAADGHVGRSRVRNPAPLILFHVLCFHFCVSCIFLFIQQCTRLLVILLF